MAVPALESGGVPECKHWQVVDGGAFRCPAADCVLSYVDHGRLG